MNTTSQPATCGMRTEPMSRHSVFCIATTPFQASRIVDRLKTAHFPDDSISTLLTDPRMSWPFGQEIQNKAMEGALAGAGTGALIGVTWGWIAGIGALTIPGVGLFIAAGPVIAAMGCATLGAALGGICGGLMGMGIPELEAKRYEGKILKGDILLSVHTDTTGDIYRAKDIFNDSRADDIWGTDSRNSRKPDSAETSPPANTSLSLWHG